jgi:hypothetical protein
MGVFGLEERLLLGLRPLIHAVLENHCMSGIEIHRIYIICINRSKCLNDSETPRGHYPIAMDIHRKYIQS